MMAQSYSLYEYLETLPSPETAEERALVAYSNMLDDISIAMTEYRMKNNLSQAQLAEKLHLSQSLISSYECGARNISIEKLCSLMAGIGKNVSLQLEDTSDNMHSNEKAAPYPTNTAITAIYKFAA